MKSFAKLIVNIISILSLICYSCSSEVKELEPGKCEEITLDKNETEILLPVNDQKGKMLVDVALTHPSDYNITFQVYNEPDNIKEIIEPQNSKEFHLDEEEMYIYPKRKLATDLGVKEKLLVGQSKFTLDLTEDINNIILTVIKKENVETDSNVEKSIFVRYKFITEEESLKYDLEKKEISLNKDKDMLSISFGGIKQLVENADLKNFITTYTINLFDKNTLTSKYENVYIYALKENPNLFSTTIKLKGNATQKENYLKIKAPLNDRNEQLLLINAIVKNGDEDEQLLHYEFSNFIVEEQSEERVWPDDDDGKNETSGNNETSKNDEEDEEEKAREKNRPIFYIIMGCFGGIVILTFIGIIFYIKSTTKGEIEQDPDYVDIGKIDPNTKTDKGNVNEEEE